VGNGVHVEVGSVVGSLVAVGKKVLVGHGVGDGGIMSLSSVVVGVGEITAGKVGGTISSPERGAVESK
jgi:hypothetical protein